MDKVGLNIDTNKYEELSSELELDLIALFNVMQDHFIGSFTKFIEEGKTPEEIINIMDGLLING